MNFKFEIQNRYLPSSIVNPEKEQYFDYLKSFFPDIPINTLYPKEDIKDLLIKEQNSSLN